MAGAADEVLEDLRAEGEELDRLVAGLPADGPGGWRTDTPAAGWTVAHQIAHLAWTDRRALLAVQDGAAFRREVAETLAAAEGPGGLDGASRLSRSVDEGAAEGAGWEPDALLAHWRSGRRELALALARSPHEHRIPWYGPPMGAAGMATARLMETWAHGEDVAAALRVRREPAGRLRHVAWLGVRTRDFAYAVHGAEPPAEPFRVELTAPTGGARWVYGPEDAAQRVTGEALDFCRLVTRRVHRADTDLRAVGADAERWLGIAQAFAGPPGEGRQPAGGAR